MTEELEELRDRILELKREGGDNFDAGYNNAVADLTRLIDTEINKKVVKNGS